MNKKLEKTFDLPSMEDLIDSVNHDKGEQHETSQNENEDVESLVQGQDTESTGFETEDNTEAPEEQIIQQALTTAEKIDRALPQVKDLETHDMDMDNYSTEAMKSYKELMDLGMNSEARHAGKFFEVAQTMMKNAIEAKNAKADKKLRMIELQLKKQRVDQWDRRDPRQEDVIEGEGFVVGDRNKLLDQLIQKVNENDKKPEEKDK